VVKKKGLEKMVKALKLVNELDESFVEVVLLKNFGTFLQPDYRCFDLAIESRRNSRPPKLTEAFIPG